MVVESTYQQLRSKVPHQLPLKAHTHALVLRTTTTNTTSPAATTCAYQQLRVKIPHEAIGCDLRVQLSQPQALHQQRLSLQQRAHRAGVATQHGLLILRRHTSCAHTGAHTTIM